MLKKFLIALCSIVTLYAITACNSVPNNNEEQVTEVKEEKTKVIFNTDMVEMLDDGIAMMMLVDNPNVDLLGIVNTVGNSWAEDGVAFTVRQLQLKEKNIPIYMGSKRPDRANGGFGKKIMKRELKKYGDVMAGYVGAPETTEPKDWKAAYLKQYKEKAPNVDIKQNGVDFMIEMVHKYPHEITIAAIGPATDIAKAVKKDPEFASLVKKIIFMNGAFWVNGNTTPDAEFNAWFDPESTKTAFRANFPDVEVVSLDLTDKLTMNYERFKDLTSRIDEPEFVKMWNRKFFSQEFKKNNNIIWFVWDVAVSSVINHPEFVKETKTAYIDCISEKGKEYGKTIGYDKNEAPKGTREAKVITELDYDAFWNELEVVFDKL